MNRERWFPAVMLLPVTAWLVASCSDKVGDRTPTEPGGGPSLDQARSDRNEGSGSRFRAIGNARMTRDPENPTNVVLKVVSDGNTPVGAGRDLKRVQLWQLDHQLNFKWAFVAPHSCGGGSPRIILLVDADGDGDRDFSANGHVNPPLFAGCPNSTPVPNDGGASPSALLWRFDDVTDENRRWEITGGVVPGFPAFPGATWDELEQLVHTAFPNHRVLHGRLIEDFNNTGPGTSYYDLITIFDLTLGTRGQVNLDRRGHDEDDEEGEED